MTTTTSDSELVEREDLTHRLEQAGVDVSPDTSLEGLRGLANLLTNTATGEPDDARADDQSESSSRSSTSDVGEETGSGFGETAAGTATGPNGGALFNVDDYADPTLALPAVDGKNIDRIAVAVTGEVMLDRSDPNDVALMRRLKLGQPVELWLQGRVTGFAAKGATSRDGDLDVVVLKRTIHVEGIRTMGPEDLAEAALEVASQARDAAENQDARDRLPSDA